MSNQGIWNQDMWNEGVSMKRSIFVLIVGLLMSPSAWSQVCTETITLRDTACAGSATCVNKQDRLTWQELDNNMLNIQDMCDWIDSFSVSSDSITEGDSSVVVTDAGTGKVDVTVDAGVVGTWNAAGLAIGGADGNDRLLLPLSVGAGLTAPTLAFGDGDFGFSELSDDYLVVASPAVAGNYLMTWRASTGAVTVRGSGLYGHSTWWALPGEIATATNPNICYNESDLDSGLGGTTDNPCLIAGGVTGLCVPTTASGVNYVNITPAATGVGPIISTTGETNVDLNLTPAGTGKLKINGNTELAMYNDAGQLNGLRVVGNYLYSYLNDGFRLQLGSDNVGMTYDTNDIYAAFRRYTNTQISGAALYPSGYPALGIVGGLSIPQTSGTDFVSIGLGNSYATHTRFTPASGSANFVGINAHFEMNQSGTATGNYTLFRGNMVETSFLGTTGLLLDLLVGGVSKFSVSNSGNVDMGDVLSLNCVSTAPTGSDKGDIYCDSDLTVPCYYNGTNWVQMDDFSTTCS